MRATKIILALAIVAAGLFVAVRLVKTRPQAARSPVEPTRTLVEIMSAERSRESVKVIAMGTVIPAKTVMLQPEVSGRIIEQSPELAPGGRFRKGDLIARIDPRDYELAVEQEKAGVERAGFELRLEEGRQVVAQSEWKLLKSGIANTETGRELALRKPHLRKARADLAAAKSRLKLAELNVERTTIRAPFNALVQEEFIDVGQLVGPQTALAKLAGADRFWIRVSIPVEQLSFIRLPGAGGPEASKAEVVHRPGPELEIKREGRIVRLLGDLDPVGRMARLLVAVDDPLGLESRSGTPLLLGAYVRVTIEGKEFDDVCVLPRTALRDGNRIWIMDDEDRLEVREVTIVWEREDAVLIRHEFEEGTRIITSRIAVPVPGMKLHVAGSGSREAGPAGEPESSP